MEEEEQGKSQKQCGEVNDSRCEKKGEERERMNRRGGRALGENDICSAKEAAPRASNEPSGKTDERTR